MIHNPHMRGGESNADFCRRMGWDAGTYLIGDEGFGDSIIKLTAIGERSILALTVMTPGEVWFGPSYEGNWTLECRNWRVIAGVPFYWGA